MLDFPNSPTVGATYTGPGGVVWTFDGAKWASGTSSAVYAPIASPAFTGDPTAPTPAYGDNDTSIATTAFVQAAVAPTENNVGRNLLHNSLFNVQQRGAGPWTLSVYMADRWRQDFSLDVVTSQITTFTDVQRAAIGDEEAINCLAVNVAGNAGAGSFTLLSQPTENVRRLANKTVTVSLWAYATTGAPKIGIGLRQYFGTGGSPSAVVDLNAVPVTLTGTPTRYSATITLPSIAGKTLGTNNDHYTRLGLWLSSGATNNVAAGGIGVQSATFVFWGVQLEIGSVATPLDKPDPRYDLANCQRFYQTGYWGTSGNAVTGVNENAHFALPVTMRAVPAITYDLSGGSANIATAAPIAVTAGYMRSSITVTANGGFLAQGGFTASADL